MLEPKNFRQEYPKGESQHSEATKERREKSGEASLRTSWERTLRKTLLFLLLTAHRLLLTILQILLRHWMLLVFALPEDCYHPPATAVVHQLNTIYAALKWLRIARGVPRFVGAESVNDLAKLFRLP